MITDAQILDDLIRREGGYSNRAADRGGPTNFGITQKTLSAWRGRHCDAHDVRDMRVDEARAIYAEWYLKPVAGAPDDVRAHMVDIAVNHGPDRAHKLWAAAQDAALHSTRPLGIELAIARIKFYGHIVHDDHGQAENINGWLNRACEFL